ncbi:MAG: patatin-like phospholipase family protein, partial [bacterium]
STGPVIQAVVASAAIPTVYPPVRIGELHLVDGSIANNAPISTAVALGATRTIVLPTGFACAMEHVPTSTIGMALQTIVLYSVRQLVRDIERFTNVVNLAVVPPLCPLTIAPHDFSRAGALIDRAQEATTHWLDNDGLERHGVPGALLPHED